MKNRIIGGAYVAAYIGSIVIANWATSTFGLVPAGFGLLVTAGTYAAAAALILRDGVQVYLGKLAVVASIAAGIALSYLLADPFIAVASAVAFAASEVVDWGVFSKVRGRSIALAVLASSIVAAPVDTVLFLWIAGFDLTFEAVAGQVIVKTAMALIAAAVIAVRARTHTALPLEQA